jgi:cobalt-zinc-cadmium efflux system outer membrane protein
MRRIATSVVALMIAIAWVQPLAGQERAEISAGPQALADSALSLDRVLEMAQKRNPRLIGMRAAAVASATRVAEASTLPDPTIQLGIMNFGLPNLNADMPTSMAPSIQLLQRVPFPGKLRLRGEISGAMSTMVNAASDEARWQVRERAAGLFYDLYAIDRQTAVLRETFALLSDFQTIARAMYASGTGRQTDVLRADVEVARMDGDIREREAARKAVAARLNSVLDLPIDGPVGSPVLGALPATVPDQRTLSTWGADCPPKLAVGRVGVEQARDGLVVGPPANMPDQTVGLVYGQRNRGLGTERMGSAVVGFSLPIHAGSRQLAAREEAEAGRRMASADLDLREAEVGARIGELLAELERARSLITLFRDEVLPEARATVESALSSYRVGAVDFMTLIDAQMTVNRYDGDLFVLLSDYGKAIAGIEAAVGRTLPPSAAFITEEPNSDHAESR